MHIISRKKLSEAGTQHSTAITPLDSWYRIAKSARWRSLEDVRRTYRHADGVTVCKRDQKRIYTVFNIGDFRLITEIFYDDWRVLIRHVLTHAEYDKEDWKK